MDRFHSSGFLKDFARRPDSAEDRAKAWSAIVSSWMDNTDEMYGTPEVPSMFFNPLKDETPGEPASESIVWDAFPRFLTRWFEGDDEPDEKWWLAAETLRPLRVNGRALRRVNEEGFLREELSLFYRQQYEYCEWHVDRDGEGRITRIVLPEEARPRLKRAAAPFGLTDGLTENGEESMGEMTGEPEAKGGLGSRLGR